MTSPRFVGLSALHMVDRRYQPCVLLLVKPSIVAWYNIYVLFEVFSPTPLVKTIFTLSTAFADFSFQTHRLENTHYFAIEIHCTGDVVDLRLGFYHQYAPDQLRRANLSRQHLWGRIPQ
jgi:hypothetical protein